MKIYIVKSFGPDSGYMNLKAFTNSADAYEYASKVEGQIPDFADIEDEFIEVEEMTLETSNERVD